MAMFIKIDDLKNERKSFTSYEEAIHDELKEIGCEYEFEIEDEFIKINFITEEEKYERQCKNIVIKNLIKDIPEEVFNSFNIKSKEKFFDNVLIQFKKQFGSYSEVLKVYDEAVLPGIMKTYKMLEPILNSGTKIVDVIDSRNLLRRN